MQSLRLCLGVEPKLPCIVEMCYISLSPLILRGKSIGLLQYVFSSHLKLVHGQSLQICNTGTIMLLYPLTDFPVPSVQIQFFCSEAAEVKVNWVGLLTIYLFEQCEGIITDNYAK